MPCQGPSEAENRTMRQGIKLCKLIVAVDAKSPLPSNYFFLSIDELKKVKIYRNGYEAWMYNNEWFDELTAMLCDKIRNFTEEQQDYYLYDGKDSNARQLAEWWDKHQKEDKRRSKNEVEKKASQIAKEESEKTFQEVFEREKKRLMEEK